MKVLVLMSTYNGENYLKEQIESILTQEEVEVYLLVRDDGSTDKTMVILEDYSSRFSNISFYKGSNVGACMSFFDLLTHANGYDYYAFSDQDDVWDNNKLCRAIEKLKNQPNNLPVLYCSNLNVVDENLNFCRQAYNMLLNPHNRYTGLVDFYATGCTEVFNQVAADFTKAHIRRDCLMHDSWMFMICNFFGHVIYDEEAHIKYRQHRHNVVGASKDNYSRIKSRFFRVLDRTIQPRLRNAQLLADEFNNILDRRDLDKILKIANYKKNIFSWINLFFDFEIRSNILSSDIRYRLLLLLREI